MDSWSPEKIRENARNWSLEGDARLLELMESISQNLENRTTTTKLNLDKLKIKLDQTNISLGNTTNKLLALQHSQFVENRVYEEDETIATTSSENVEENKNPILTPLESVKLAIDNGLIMMNECYEKVSVDLDESDNDDDDDDEDNGIRNIAFRAKDPYLDQPIPFIIGTKDWKEKWHIGLYESDAESDDENNQPEFSDSSSNPSISVSIPSNAPTISESEGSIWGLNTVQPSTSRDIFQNSDDETNVEVDPQQTNKEEIAQIPKPAARSIFPEQKTIRQVSNLFVDDEPPEIEPIQKIQKKPIDFFDDDDQDELFTDDFQSKTKSNKPNYNTNLFDDEPPPILDENITTKSKTENKSIFVKQNTTRTNVTNLFDDEPPDDEDDFYASKVVKEKSTIIEKPADNEKSVNIEKPKNVDTKKITNLFDDNESNDFDDIFIKPNPLPIKTTERKALNLFSDDTDEDDDFEAMFKKSKDTQKKSIINSNEDQKKSIINSNENQKIENKIISNNLEEENKSKPVIESIPKPQEIIQPKIVEEKEEPKKIIRNLFDSDEDDEKDDKFDDIFAASKSKIAEKPKPILKTSLFDDDETTTNQIAKMKQNSLFDDSTDDDNDNNDSLFLSSSNINSINKPQQITTEEALDNINKNDSKISEKIDVNENLSVNNDENKNVPSTTLLSNNNSDEIQVSKNLETETEDEIFVKSNETKPQTKLPLFIEDEGDDDFDSLFNSKNLESVIEKIIEPPIDDKKEIEDLFDTQDPPMVIDVPSDIPDDKNNNQTDDDDWLIQSDKSIFDKFNDTFSDSYDSKSENKSALQYTPVTPIFDDMPPPDDLPQKTHVYYDDIDTFQTPKINIPVVNTTPAVITTPPTNMYIISDEPPLDDYRDEVDDSNTNFKDKLNLFSSQKEKNLSPPKQSMPPPKKLNTNLNINIGALLPGAKRPIIRKTESQSSSTESEIENQKTPIDTTPKYNTEQNATNDSNLLLSLNKSRAKIQTKRKPSTRKGRQEIYRKSIIIDDEDEIIEPISDIPKLEIEKNDENIVKEIKTTTQQEKSIFSSDEESSIVKSSQPLTTKSLKTITSTKLFDSDDDDEDDNLFGPPTKTIQATQSKNLKQVKVSSASSKPAKLFDDSDDNDDDEDDIFKTKSQPVKKSSLSATSKQTGTIKTTSNKISNVASDDPLADLWK